MKLEIGVLEDLKEMKERMDAVWNDLFETSHVKSKEGIYPFEKLPKFEGTGRRSIRARSTRRNQ